MKLLRSKAARMLSLALVLLFSGLQFGTFSAEEDVEARMEGLLQLLYHHYQADLDRQAVRVVEPADASIQSISRIVKIDFSGREPVLPVTVITTDQGTQMTARGFRRLVQIGNVLTVRVPVSRLAELASLPSVLDVQSSKIRRPMAHDVSVPETTATLARQAYGVSGRNVIVGVIDTGIDWRHDDFRSAGGATRIKYLWDMSDSRGPEPSDLPGTGGTVYTEQQINNALSGTGSVAEVDAIGHGTHVAGSAAGNGRATGNGYPSGTFTGMAPEADIVVVKALRAGSDGFAEDDVIAGLRFIDNRARELGRPYVVNLSLGGHWGSHDGTSAEEQAIDSLVGSGIRGKVICIAAGNEGADDIHASGTVRSGITDTLTLSVPQRRSLAGVDLWYPGSDELSVRVVTPDSLTTSDIGPGQYFDATAPDGTRVQIESTRTNSLNNSRSITLLLTQTYQGREVTTGNWKLELSVRSGPSGKFDAWVLGDAEFGDHVDPSRLVGMPGTARNAITAASYITKNRWSDLDGVTRTYRAWGPAFDADVAAKSPFSNPGPTRDGRLKPEISAPGQGIASARSTNAQEQRQMIVPDGNHMIMQGTSMATPHVAGAVALILEANPSLDAIQVRDLLQKSARADDFTGRVPNYDFGYGKMDVREAVKQIRGTSGAAPPIPGPVITTLEPSGAPPGATVQVTVNGANFTGTLAVTVSPSSGITINRTEVLSPVKVGMNLTIAAGAAAGNYQFTVTIDGRRSNPGVFRVEPANAPSPDPADSYEPNDSLEQARPMPSDGMIAGRINPRTDIDVFRFPATMGRSVVFDLDANTLSSSNTLDSIIGVFDGSGNLIDYNDDDGMTLDSLLEWTPRVTATYFIVVAAIGDSEEGPSTSGEYVLKVTGHAGDIRADQSPPRFDRDWIWAPQLLNRTNELFCEWYAEDPESGIERFEYAVGTAPGASDVVPFTRTGNTSVYLSGLSLRNGFTYYFSVRAFNVAGLQSGLQYSAGTRIDTTRTMYSLYYPRVVALPGSYTGLALANPAGTPAQVICRLYDNNGNLVLGSGIANPVSLMLYGGEPLADLSTEFFSLASGDTPGWVEIQTTVPDVKGFFLYGADDFSFLDGADVGGKPLRDLIFHRIQESGEYQFTVLSLVNPNDAEASMTLELRTKEGALVSSKTSTLKARGRMVRLVRDLFPEVTEQIGGTLRVRSSVGLVGFELFATEAIDIGGINPQPSDQTTRELLFGQLACLGGWYTELSVTNPNSNAVEVELQAFAESGGILAAPGNPSRVRVPANGQFNAQAQDLFRFPGSNLTVGYVSAKVVDGSGGIFGHVTFGTTDGWALAALPVQTSGNRKLIFSHVAQSGYWYTGLTLLNPSATTQANVKIEVFDEWGSPLGSATESFAPREKKARIIHQIAPSVRDVFGGYILVTSDQPVIGFELFFDSWLLSLAAVPPQSLDTQTGEPVFFSLLPAADRSVRAMIRARARTTAGSLYMQLYQRRKGKLELPDKRRGILR